MDGGRGGCCIARYAGGDAKTMEKVMLKFRPIAPKPDTGGSVFGSSSSSDNKSSCGETTTYVKAGRGKRKYNTTGTKRRSYGGGRKRVRASRPLIEQQLNNNKLIISSRDESSSGDTTTTVVTLPLLPESPTHQSKTPTSRSTAPIWLSFNTAPDNNNNNMNKFITPSPINHYYYSHQQAAAVGGRYGGGVRSISGRVVVGSGVTVECVTETWISGEGLGRTDEERVRNLEWDTCPGFISDGQNRVTWTNRAYKKMVLGDEEAGEMRMSSSGGDDDQEVVVWVAMKEKVPVSYPAFTCRVRVQHTRTKEIKILPCDVWRMDGGGFAWKLDVKAALSLGR